MGHSSKAGENIFWAMNRNKPGIIKRILNALERFIARIRGKDAYLAVEQRQAAERLRDMLTGELKRAYGTEVKGEAAVESGEGKRHSLAGANSRTADLNSLGGAYQMYQNGVSMDTIRKRTGWWLGKDGKWRYEISDKEMRFNPEGYVDNPQTVGDYVKHDRLFAAYPWIMDVNVLMSENVAGDPNSLGRYVPSENFIELKTGVPTEKTKHVLIHELQHAIQNKEHFTNGTNSTVTSRYIVNLAYNNVKNNPEFKAEKSPRGKMDYIIGYLEARMDANFDDIAKYYYSRNHGEIEAQYVDKRLDMSDNARKAEPIVNYGDVYTREDVRADFIDNLKEMGYNEEQVNEILEEGIPYDNKHQNEQESLGQTGEGRKNLAGEAGRLPRQGTQRGERREVYRTGKVQVADSVKKTGQVDSLSDSTIFRRGRTDSETGRNDVREAQKRLNEVSKPEKRFSLSSADTDIYSRIFDMQREETELTNRIREIEKSDAFKNANNDLSKAIDSDNIAEGMKAYQAWRKESGYADLVDRRDALRAELEEIRTKAYNDAVSKAINEERTAIEKSGLSEADYFRKQAVKEFGYTPYFYDAGYIMPNGKMLNFSGEKGRHYGSRGQDHRAIGTIYADTNGTDALVRFMNDGNIRIMAETPGLDISASTEPSKEQYTTIRRFANEFSDGGYFAVDLSDENGKTVGTLEYEGNINPTRIVNDIKHFYETGEVREQSGLDRFRYSLTRANDEYMKAVESGDTEEQRRLVDEAAKESGYDRLFWHGSKNGGGFTEFRDWSYFTENKKYASRYAKAGDKGSLYEVYANLGNAFDTRKPECREIFDKMRSEYGLSKVQESGLPDWTDGYDIAEFIDENGLDYDSIILDEGGDLVDGKPVSRGFSYVIRSSEQVKSADPITYDDSGNVIPLTERFDSGNRDIRWSLAGTDNDRADAAEFSDSGIRYSLRKEDPPKKTLTGYKVFVVKNGKLYPPMVANPDAADTPVGVWLNADIGAQAPDSKTGRKQVKAGGKGTQGGSGSLAFRPGWHLGETPLATQFDRTNPETGKRELFPENFVWAECEIAADKNYQEEAMSYGYTKSGKFQHSLAGLPKIPVDGYYKYRTNPNPDTVPWLITGAMKVNRLLDDAEVNRILESKGLPPKNRVGGNKTLADLGLEETAKRLNGDGNKRYSLSANAAEEIKKALADKNYSSEIKLTDTTPTIMLGHNGVKNLPLMMRATHLRENILTREQAKAKGLSVDSSKHYHGLGTQLFLDVIADLDNVKEAYRGTVKAKIPGRGQNYFLLVSEKTDASGNKVNIPVFINETAKYNNVFIDTNKIATVFGNNQLRKYINERLKDGTLVRIKRRSTQSSEVSTTLVPHYRKNASSIDNSVSQNDPVVNIQSMQDVEKDSSGERHSLVKSAQSELKALQKENEKLMQDVDDLKQELQLTHGRKLSRDALISSIQKILIDGYGVKLSAKELYPHVTNLYDMFYNNTVDGKRLKKDERVDTMRIIEEMDKIVDAVIENAVGVDDTYVEMKKLLPELRNTKLVVPMDARADAAQSAGFENWAEFRKANFGRVGFANEGLPVDTYYMELSERYPELFPDGITHPGEQAAHIADVVNTIRESGINEYQLYDIEDERIRTSIKNDVMDIIGNAEKLQTFADRAAQKVEDTKLAEAMHYGADIAKLKRLNAEKVADIKAENRKRLSDMRRKYQDRVESVRERYAEARANRSEKQKQTVLRNKVLRKYTEASSMLDRPTTENHFTEAMREPIMEFLAAVDITTGKSVAKQGVYDRILRVIEAANNMAAEDGKNGLGIAETDLNVQEKQLIVDSGLLERMAAWVEANQGKKLTELSSAQLFDQIVSNEPPVGYVHLDLLQQPYFAADTVRISYEQHTEKNLRLDSRASVILAVIRLADSAGTSFSNTILSQA